MAGPLFPFSEYWWFYAAFTASIGVLLALDLGVFHRQPHAVGFREALAWTGGWAALALIFGLGLRQFAAWKFGATAANRLGLEYLAGYAVEWSLSLDNMFVFALVFRYFAIPVAAQHRVLFFGILGALFFRGVFIALGAALLRYGWVAILFGVFLIVTGVHLAWSAERTVRPERSLVVRLLGKFLPVWPNSEEARFLARPNGKLHATPALLALAFIEATDILFAIDSVPAIFAITGEPLIVYTSNVMAILGLRSMYFLLAGALGRFHLLRYGLASILVFVGLKMSWLNAAWQGHFPISISLGIIVGILAASIGLSLAFPARK